MNSVGVGTAVGLGAMIGLGIVAGDAEVVAYVATFAFYGLVSGFIFHAYQWALKGWEPPFRSKRR